MEKFCSGCLSTLADIDQKGHLEKMNNVIIIHATLDGVINKEYLETIDKSCLVENNIHYVDSKHMSPILKADEIVDILIRGFCL
jgi:coenzyme F420-reducing hydrogenase gamma subunit